MVAHSDFYCSRRQFSLASRLRVLQDAYFLDSASEINFFFEEKAFNEQGQLQTPKALAVNKIGHAMHDLDPVFSAFTRSQPVSAVLRSLGFQQPLPVQSMYIFKQPSIGGEVVSAVHAQHAKWCIMAAARQGQQQYAIWARTGL
jgi:phytanoyl-CoA hydroxylase